MTQKLLPSTIRSYIFACTNSSQDECFDRLIFGSSKVYGADAMRVKKNDFVFPLDLNFVLAYEINMLRNGTINAKQ